MTGRELAEDLARYLRSAGWLSYTEVNVPGIDGRIDVAAIKPHAYAQKDLRAYEIKTSRQDFNRDESQNKWRKYLQVFHRVYFACSVGLLAKSDMPSDAGLIVRNDNGWHVVKSARGHRPSGLTVDSILSILYRGYQQDRQLRALKDRIVAEENIPLAKKAKNIGYEIAQRLKRPYTNEDIESWATDILKLCESIAGHSFSTYGDRLEIEMILREGLTFKKYAKLLYDIGLFISGMRFDTKKTDEKATAIKSQIKLISS